MPVPITGVSEGDLYLGDVAPLTTLSFSKVSRYTWGRSGKLGLFLGPRGVGVGDSPESCPGSYSDSMRVHPSIS